MGSCFSRWGAIPVNECGSMSDNGFRQLTAHLEPQNSLLFVGTNRAGSETPGQGTSQGFETRVC